ncbi:unnamed protein product [Trypanosoma congolense IL3000]|uniref:Squalene synthase n=2 Tax=Trypanosoma congolense (strain IL3000) TaxID=1068625 RepID=F9W6V5_TRYCI|nr:unnamed protein product [Trypanosoma congolense IL3000]
MMDYFGEMYAMVRVRWQVRRLKSELRADDDDDLNFCYDILQDVSRSFALVIMQLRAGLRDAVCVFYLVLRALDTVEDDMKVPLDVKLRELPLFHTRLRDPKWRLDGVGTGRERELLQEFPRVSAAFTRLDSAFQDVIVDVCERMAAGMCDFLLRGSSSGGGSGNADVHGEIKCDERGDIAVESRKDYDLYCHYVAGLVGHGLTRLFVRSGLEKAGLEDDMARANHMGLLLQKTNIIRDFYEDICEEPPRVFWPREIWGRFTDDLHNFKGLPRLVNKPNGSNDAGDHDEVKQKALDCLNTMVADALEHLPHVIEYLSNLRDSTIFAFCAIPQVMAIATLSLVFDNGDVFHTKVKLTRGATCAIIYGSTELQSALRLARAYGRQVLHRTRPGAEGHEAVAQSVAAALATMDGVALQQKVAVQDGLTPRLLERYSALGGGLLLKIAESVFSIWDR